MKLEPKRQDFAWGAMTWLAEGEALGVSVAKMTVKPGAASPAHFHNNCHEVIHLEAGEVSQRCGDAWIIMKPGDTLTAPQGAVHQTRNLGDGEAVLTICYTSGQRHYEEAQV